MAIPWNELHTYLIYVVFGYSLLYPVVLFCLKVFSLEHPAQRLQLYLTAFLAPPAGFILYHTVFTKRCQAGLPPPGTGGDTLHYICAVSGGLLNLALPLLAAMLCLALFKAAAGYLLINRLRRRGVTPPAEVTGRVDRILGERCTGLQVTKPELIYSNRGGLSAFTAGLFRPVLVLSGALAAGLEHTELDAVLTHELVHIRHRDTLKGWLLHLLRDITFFNPLSSVLLKRSLLERERLRDREAAALSGQAAGTYAAALVKVCRLLLEQRPAMTGPASAFTGRGNDLESRVTALLRDDGTCSKMPARCFYVLLAAISAGLLLFLGLIC